MEFSEKLKTLRNKKGITQEELANAIYVSRSAVAKWENGLGLPCEESIGLLCNYFETTKDDLLHENEKESVQKNRKILKYKKLLIVACSILVLVIASTITLASLYSSGIMPVSERPRDIPDDFPYIVVEGVEASSYAVVRNFTDTRVYTGGKTPIKEEAEALPLLPYKDIYYVTLPDICAIESVRYYFLNDDYTPVADVYDLSLRPYISPKTAPMWMNLKYFDTTELMPETSEVQMHFRKNDYHVIIVEFTYIYAWVKARSFFRVER